VSTRELAHTPSGQGWLEASSFSSGIRREGSAFDRGFVTLKGSEPVLRRPLDKLSFDGSS
jgi:hypothetical protein